MKNIARINKPLFDTVDALLSPFLLDPEKPKAKFWCKLFTHTPPTIISHADKGNRHFNTTAYDRHFQSRNTHILSFPFPADFCAFYFLVCTLAPGRYSSTEKYAKITFKVYFLSRPFDGLIKMAGVKITQKFKDLLPFSGHLLLYSSQISGPANR